MSLFGTVEVSVAALVATGAAAAILVFTVLALVAATRRLRAREVRDLSAASEDLLVFGKRCGKFDISGLLHYRQTTGFDGVVESDFQTELDSIFDSSASSAPGRVHDGRHEYDLNLKIVYQGLWLQGWYSNKNRDPFIGGGLS